MSPQRFDSEAAQKLLGSYELYRAAMSLDGRERDAAVQRSAHAMAHAIAAYLSES